MYCIAIIGASLMGGWLPNFVELSHNRMQVMISLIGGLMLGIGVFHMLPHALVELGDDGPDLAAYGMMAGLIIMFLLLRLFHFHHHGPTEVPCAHDREIGGEGHSHLSGEGHEHGHVHGHAHIHEHSAVASPDGRSLSWVGVFLGMALHTLIDGLALGASVAADALHGATGLLGLGTFLAVWLHKPLDAVSITSVMAAGGWSRSSRTLVNAGFSLICPAGAALFVLGIGEFSNQSTIVGCALAVSAGVFLCIALSDLLPEMEFHSHNRVQLTAALLAGVGMAWAIGFLEPAHAHSHRPDAALHSHAE
jgi:zinc and cadmium transporter